MQSQQTVSKLVNENPALKAFDKSVKEEIKSIQGNLEEILKLLKFDEERRGHEDISSSNKASQAEVDSLEIQIRTTSIIKSTEALSKIVFDLKDLTILNDFKSINSQITEQCNFLKQKETEIDRQLMNTKDVLIKLLGDLQHEYYSSNYK